MKTKLQYFTKKKKIENFFNLNLKIKFQKFPQVLIKFFDFKGKKRNFLKIPDFPDNKPRKLKNQQFC